MSTMFYSIYTALLWSNSHALKFVSNCDERGTAPAVAGLASYALRKDTVLQKV